MYHVADTVVGVEDFAVDKTERAFVHMKFTF